LAHECADQKQSRKALILKQNKNDVFRFACALKTQEGLLKAHSTIGTDIKTALFARAGLSAAPNYIAR
jgi:hypothetical protein